MFRYKLHINAGIEMTEEVEANTKEEAEGMAYDLIPGSCRVYNFDVEAEEIEGEK